jgi:hypothetical protein
MYCFTYLGTIPTKTKCEYYRIFLEGDYYGCHNYKKALLNTFLASLQYLENNLDQVKQSRLNQYQNCYI